MGDRYPASDHRRLNLPCLLFHQSSLGLQAAVVSKMKREHNLRFPEGRKTFRYIFHMTVTYIDADIGSIKVGLDLDKLPKWQEPLDSWIEKFVEDVEVYKIGFKPDIKK